MDGFLVLDKPAGMTSHDVVSVVRRTLRVKKVGHTGTLDPFATGVLPIAIGEGTKAIPFLDEQVKEYQATMVLGIATDTQDCTGTILSVADWREIEGQDIERVFASFVGRIAQTPPMFSAIKRDGVPLYRLARKGIDIERPSRLIDIHSLHADHICLPHITMTVSCSRGTYVRTLAHDIGASLGCGAHLVALRRTRSGPFSLAQAIKLDDLAALVKSGTLRDLFVPVLSALSYLPALSLSEQGERQVRCGRMPALAEIELCSLNDLPLGGRVRLVREDKLVAVAENTNPFGQDGCENLKLLRVFN